MTWDYYGTPPHNRSVYGYQYVYPSDCLRIAKLPNLAAGAESDQGVQYLREGNWIYSDQDASPVRYVRKELDPTRWDSLLQSVITYRIATDIVFAVTSQPKLVQLTNAQFALMLGTAVNAALSEGAESTPERDRWEDA